MLYVLVSVHTLGLYCSGWVKRGPVGVIVSTMTDAFETGKMIVTDISSGELQPTADHVGKQSILQIVQEKGELFLLLNVKNPPIHVYLHDTLKCQQLHNFHYESRKHYCSTQGE